MGGKNTRRRTQLLLLATLLAVSMASPARAFWGDGRAEEAERLATLLELRPGAVVADIGAGDGTFSLALARRVGPTGRVYATELEAEQQEEIREAAREAGLGNIVVVQAGTTDIGVPEGCCDAIFMRNVYHHLTQPAEIDASIYRALRPGGVFAVIDFLPSFWLAPFTPKGLPKERSGHGVTPEHLTREVEAAGFELVRVEDDWPGGLFADPFCALFRKPAPGGAGGSS